MDRRVAGVLGAVAAVILAGSGASLYASRHAPSPVLILDAKGDGTAEIQPSDGGPPIPVKVSTSKSTVIQGPSVAQVLFGGASTAGAPPSQTPPATRQATPTGLYVHVAGAVKRPDLYVLPPGSRVYNAIKAAGGAASSADRDAVNLAEPVSDGEKVYVPRKGETDSPAGAGNTLGHTSSTSSAPALKTAEHESHGHKQNGFGGPDKLTDPSEGTVDINTASAEQMERLPGIGPAMADRILDYRTQNGKFRTLDDLRDVGGIGDRKLAKLAPFVRL
jgi:competence protein ComEA